MTEIKHKWKDLLVKRNTRSFVGRDHIIEHFRLNCLDTVPRDLVIFLRGIAGVGKSTTIARLREIADEYDIFSTYIDSSIANPVQEKAVLRFMCGIAQQFSSNEIPLTQFNERYREYIDALQLISDDADAPGHPFDVIGGLHDQDPWYRQTWDSYLNETFSANTSALVRQPVDQLTPIFIHDLNTWALVRRILLCFDDWHLLEDQIGVWLRSIMLEGEFSTRIWVILATRDALTSDWDNLGPLLVLHELSELTEREVQMYLKGKGISESQRVSDVFAFSDGLPVLVDLLSSTQEGIAGDLALSPLDRYFKWLSNTQRRVVLLASVARQIDVQVLDSILGKEGDAWFEWLKRANLLTQKGDTWVYHSALRSQFLSWARREMYGATYAAHVALRAYYLNREGDDESDSSIPGETVSASTSEAIYHGLMIGESGALRHAILSFIQLARNNYSVAGELIEVFEQASKAQENQNAVVEWTVTLKELWNTFCASDWLAAAGCCEVILKREALDADVKSAVELFYNAIQARFPRSILVLTDDDEEITDTSTGASVTHISAQSTEVNVELSDSPASQVHTTEQKISLSASPDGSIHPDQSEEIAAEQSSAQSSVQSPTDQEQPDRIPAESGMKSDTEISFDTPGKWLEYAGQRFKAKAYAEALDAYNQALELDPEPIGVHIGRARVLTQLRDFSSAIQSYDAVLGIDPNNVSALRNRGWLHIRQHHYAQALKDYDRAVNLVPDDVTLICARANVYFRLKDYTNALRGYDEAIRRDTKYTEAYLNRGVTHAVFQEYRRAIADFNQAITLDPTNGYAYHRRGRAFAKLQQFELARSDFNRALELIPHLVGIYIDMGLLYTKQSEYSEALKAYLQAIKQDPNNATAHYNAACVAALLGDVDEACRKLDTAIELHPPYREMAVTDLDFSSIRQTPEFQKRVRSN